MSTISMIKKSIGVSVLYLMAYIANVVFGFIAAAVTLLASWCLVSFARFLGVGDSLFFKLVDTFSAAGSLILFFVFTIISIIISSKDAVRMVMNSRNGESKEDAQMQKSLREEETKYKVNTKQEER